MAFTIKVDIVSAESTVYKGNAICVFLSGELGELGIYPGHLQLLSRLKPGYVRVQLEDGSEEVFYISGGFVEVQPDIVTVLADIAERAQDIDIMAATEAREKAERLLNDKQSEVDYAAVLAELAQSTAQIQAIAQLRKKLR